MTKPEIKGWCPGAWRPMQSGDGSIVRVRPRLARLTRIQVLGLSALAQHFGSGMVDVTNRANLQIRGIREADHDRLLSELDLLGLIDADQQQETRRNILVTPFWKAGDDTHRLTHALLSRLVEFPELPAKFGFAIDTGSTPVLSEDPADIRLERAEDGRLSLRADGASSGCPVTLDDAVDRSIDLARWFSMARLAIRSNANPAKRPPTRMARLLTEAPLPEKWMGHATSKESGFPRCPGTTEIGPAIGLPFGQIPAAVLSDLVERSGACAIRVTPWRCLILENGQPVEDPAVVTQNEDPLLTTDACAGAPFCPSASVETRQLARFMAGKVAGSLHISGCAKGCARSKPADVTLVGRDGRFDLVLDGSPWEEPRWRGLAPDDVIRKLT